jgi:hypothetical protein
VKDSAEILARVRGLLCIELDQRFDEASKRLPHLCMHNHRQPLDERKTVDGVRNPNFNRVSLPVVATIGLCMLGADSPESWQGAICEDPVDAQRCPYFLSSRSKEIVLKEFQEQVGDSEWLAKNLPGISELLWAAGASSAPRIPYWKRLVGWVTRIRVEPVRTTVDASLLLPSGSSDEAVRS